MLGVRGQARRAPMPPSPPPRLAQQQPLNSSLPSLRSTSHTLDAYEASPASFAPVARRAASQIATLDGTGLANILATAALTETWDSDLFRTALAVLRSRNFTPSAAALLHHVGVAVACRAPHVGTLPRDVADFCARACVQQALGEQHVYDALALSLKRATVAPYSYRTQHVETGYLLWLILTPPGQPTSSMKRLVRPARMVLIADGVWNCLPRCGTQYDAAVGRVTRDGLSLHARLMDRNLKDAGFRVSHISSHEVQRFISSAQLDIARGKAAEDASGSSRGVKREDAQSLTHLLRCIVQPDGG